MEKVATFLENTPIPKMVKVRQYFDDNRILNLPDTVRKVLRESGLLNSLYPGMRVAITAGSRGIANIAQITRIVVEEISLTGAAPFIVPAMGSHGGANAEGQRQVLESLGITSDNMGCPIFSSMRVSKIGVTEDGQPVYLDANAAEADGIVLINRVKAHTSFTGSYESGLMKMMAIGLGKREGADICHQDGHGRMAENVNKFGKAVLKHAKILFGLALIENAYNQTCDIVPLPPEEILEKEPILLKKSKSLMASILFSNVDVLVVDRMGKNISGLGMDPHVTGSFVSIYATGPPRPSKLVVLDLTPETHGNGTGIGVADITTRQLVDKIDFEATYFNCFTAAMPQAARIPVVMSNHKLAIQCAIKTAPGFNKEKIRLIRLSDTLHLDEIEISQTLLDDARDRPDIDIISDPYDLVFDEAGNLF